MSTLSSTNGGGGSDGDSSQSNNRSSRPAATTTSPSSSSQPQWCNQCRSSVILQNDSHVCPLCNSDFVEGRQLPHLRLDPHDRPVLPIMDSLQPHDILRSIRDSLLRFDRRTAAPAPKASIDAIPDAHITEDLLSDDPQLMCAICKDEFVLGSEAKRLPCSHIFHGDCVLPWLSRRNSCPICRFKLPTVGSGEREEQERSHLLRNDGLSRTVRRMTISSENQMTPGWTATQLAEVLSSLGPIRPTNSVETVTSARRAEDASSHVAADTSSVPERIDRS